MRQRCRSFAWKAQQQSACFHYEMAPWDTQSGAAVERLLKTATKTREVEAEPWWGEGGASLTRNLDTKRQNGQSNVVARAGVGVPTLTTAGGGLIRWLLLAAWFCALPPVY